VATAVTEAELLSFLDEGEIDSLLDDQRCFPLLRVEDTTANRRDLLFSRTTWSSLLTWCPYGDVGVGVDLVSSAPQVGSLLIRPCLVEFVEDRLDVSHEGDEDAVADGDDGRICRPFCFWR